MFRTAPEAVSKQHLLLDTQVNGVSRGTVLIEVAHGRIGLSAAAQDALGLALLGPSPVWIGPGDAITYTLDLPRSRLALNVPPHVLRLQRLAPELHADPVRLSPEAWGAVVNYDLNARRSIGALAGPAGVGGLADLRLLGPDLLGDFGWADNGSAYGGNGPIRLDSTLMWRPESKGLAVSVGDATVGSGPMDAGRAYRFGGIEVGTDFAGAVEWASAPIASFTGSAQAQSTLDLYLNGQRSLSTVSTGGPYALTLPVGAASGSANLLVTDVTGRSVVVPIELPRVDAQLLRPGAVMWSAGLGAPRFGYGTVRTTYAPDLYGHAGLRYGLTERLTVRARAEAGPGLGMGEFGFDQIVTPSVALRGTVAVSRSRRGLGGSGRLGLAWAGPWGLSLDVAAAQTTASFDDVVSVSGRRQAARTGSVPFLTTPMRAELSARLAWRLTETFGVSAAYQQTRYPDTGSVGLASLSADYTLGGLPLFANAFRSFGQHKATSVLVGVAFQLGPVQGSISTGASSGAESGFSGTASLSQPLQEEPGSTGWSLVATRQAGGAFMTAEAQTRTGYATPGVAIQSFGRTTSGLLTLRGSAGVVGNHPFAADPISGGMIVVDAERAGVPVRLNGVDRGKTSWDGKLAVGGAVPGIPQSVSFDSNGLPLDVVPAATDGQVTTRAGGATIFSVPVRAVGNSAQMVITLNGAKLPLGSVAVGRAASAPIGKNGQVYLPEIDKDEVLTVELPDGRTCRVDTHFDGHGGVGRRLGTLPCQGVQG